MIKGVIGCDVSHWQDKIDWSKVDTDFAFVKAKQGTSFVDSELNNNWKGLKANKIIRGTYHFLDAKTASAGAAEAKHYLATMAKLGGLQKGDLPLVLDYEGDARPDGARAFVKALKAAGHNVILYCSASVVPNDLFGADYLWVAQYGPERKPDAKNWTFWQYSDGVFGAEPQSTPGIGPCDMDKFNGSMKDLRKFVGLPTRDDVPVTPPPPPPVDESEEEKKPSLLERLRKAGRLTKYRKRHHGRPQAK